MSRRPWLIEALCAIAAFGMALVVVTHLAHSSGRGEMMFLDGDSMLTAIFARSVLEGAAQDWAMSASLFVPEFIAFTALAATGLSVTALQFLSAVLNFMALYLALRACAMTLPHSRARSAASALLAYLAVIGFALLEGEGGRSSLEPASLIAMTTYYSATVLATLLAVGLAVRLISRDAPPLPLVVTLAGLVVLSVFSNPLFVAWAVLPLLVVLTAVGIFCGRWHQLLFVAGTLIAGSVLGFLLRMPMRHAIVIDTVSYLRPAQMRETWAYHGRLLAERLAEPGGWIALVVTAGLVISGIVLSVLFARARAAGPLLLALFSWFAPLATNIGFIVLGSGAARYLQLWAFAPVLALVALGIGSGALRTRDEAVAAGSPDADAQPARLPVMLAGAAAAVGVCLGLVALPAAVHAATSVDESLTCAVDWVNDTDRVGGGQFWSIRAIKAHVDDPARVLQVRPSLQGDGWLIDRGDFVRHTSVSFLISDWHSSGWQLPESAQWLPFTIVECGRFRITDFGDAQIELGPRSP